MGAAARKMRDAPSLTIDYDQPVDVLMVVAGDRVPVEGNGLPGGVELDYSIESGLPCGAKVIGFRKYGWADHIPCLSAVIAVHLGIDTDYVTAAIESRMSREIVHE